MTRKVNRSSGLGVLPLCFPSIPLSKMPLISLTRIFRQKISTAKWYKVGQPCYEDKIQELNTDFVKIYITPEPSRAPMGKVPLPVLKELEHQARQNISMLNYATTFAKTSSTCNALLEKCQNNLKSTLKKMKY